MSTRARNYIVLNSDNIYNDYYLYDTFSTSLATGSVNGMLAEPVGGARTVTDTNSKISIAGGVLSFAGGKATPAWGDPGLWYPAVTRVAMRVLICQFTYSGALSQAGAIGFDAAQTGRPDENAWRFDSSLRISEAASVVVGAFTTATPYTLAIVLRASGALYFIKGGAFATWTLMWISISGTTGTLYPAIAGEAAVFTADNIRVPKRLFIPVPLQSDGFSAATTDGAGNAEANGAVGNVWTGATWGVAGGLASNTPTDVQERVVNGNFSAWTADNPNSWSVTEVGDATSNVTQNPAGQCEILGTGANVSISQTIQTVGKWYRASVDVKAVSSGAVSFGDLVSNSLYGVLSTTGVKTFTNRALSTTLLIKRGGALDLTIDDVSLIDLSLPTLFRSLVHSSANVLCDVEIVRTAGTQAGLVLNLDSAASPANFVIAYLDGGGNCKLDKCVAGVYTNMITAAVTYSAGAVLRVVKDGTAYRLFYNNLAVGTVTTIADAGIVNNTLHGLFSTYSANTFDNYICWARGNEGQYGGLDAS